MTLLRLPAGICNSLCTSLPIAPLPLGISMRFLCKTLKQIQWQKQKEAKNKMLTKVLNLTPRNCMCIFLHFLPVSVLGDDLYRAVAHLFHSLNTNFSNLPIWLLSWFSCLLCLRWPLIFAAAMTLLAAISFSPQFDSRKTVSAPGVLVSTSVASKKKLQSNLIRVLQRFANFLCPLTDR